MMATRHSSRNGGHYPPSRIVSKAVRPTVSRKRGVEIESHTLLWSVVAFKRNLPKTTGINPALRVNRAPLGGVLGDSSVKTGLLIVLQHEQQNPN